MKRLLYFAILSLLCSSAFSQIDYTVTDSSATKVTKTEVSTVFVIDGQEISSVVDSSESEAIDSKAVIVRFDTAAPILRVKSRTTKVHKLDKYKFAVTTPGKHNLEVLGIGIIDGELFFDEIEVMVDVGQGPNPPPVDPVDPDPVDPVTTSPFEASGFRVLLLYETATAPLLPASQQIILRSGAVARLLNSSAVIDPNTQYPEWRFVDFDTTFEPGTPFHQVMQTEYKKDTPWLFIGDGTKGYSGPLPQTSAEMLTLLQKYL